MKMGDLNGSSCLKISFLLKQISQHRGCRREHRGRLDGDLQILFQDVVRFESIDRAGNHEQRLYFLQQMRCDFFRAQKFRDGIK